MKTTVLYLDHTGKLGGAEFALERLMRSIDRTKIEPVVLLAEDGAASQLMRDLGVETHVLLLDEKVRQARKDTLKALSILHPGRLATLLSYSWRVARFAKERGVQIIHTNSLKAHIYGGIAGRLAGLPVIWHLRDFIDSSYLPKAAVGSIRLLARVIPSYVIAVSQSVMNKLHLSSAGKISPVATKGLRPSDNANTTSSLVVHDGLSDEIWLDDDLGNFPKTWPETVRIGIVGRLASWKGQHVFLQAAAKLLKAGHKVKFVIVGAPIFGEHDYEKELRELVRTMDITEQVEFLGFRSNIPEVLGNLDILVHASTSADPCPNTILEGMAAGLPVVGSNGGGVPELITDGKTGLLFAMGDADGLASALESLLEDPAWARLMGQAGNVRVRRHFTAARVARQVEGVYREIIHRGKAPARELVWSREASIRANAGALK